MKNKHNLQRLIGGLIVAVGVVFIALGVLESPPNDIFVVIGLPFLIVGGIWYFIATSLSRGICDKCGQSMKGCSYEYQESKREYTEAGNSVNVKVHIRATCPHCGQDKIFEKTFYAGHNSDNIQFQVDQFCRSHFGH